MLADVVHRPLGVRRRPDLIAAVERVGVRQLWRVKDPVSLEYFEFNEHEYAILNWLDGRVSASEIKARFEREFAPLQLSFAQLQNYVSNLFQAGLVLVGAPGQGRRLLERRRDVRRRETVGSPLNVLAFRIRGIDPQPILNWLEPRTRWLFSAWFLTLCGAIVMGAAALVAVQFDVFRARLPSFQEFLTPSRIVWLAAALTTAKLLHELGHALTCRRFGGECHELGIMFLVFTPCLYCNVSDAWMLSGRWPRMAISAAGVVVELVLAAVCTLLWWFSQPGLFNTLCLNIMVICSVNTLVFNGNPLLRYDGYFVLSDLLRESNLAQKSSDLLRRAAEEWCLGIPFRDQTWRLQARPALVATYGILSVAYRGFVLTLILWFCYTTFKEWRLPTLGTGLVVLALAGVLYRPASSATAFLRDPLNRRRLDRGRIAWLSLSMAALCAAAMLVPLPRRIAADVVLEARGAPRVYVPVPGRLRFIAPVGTPAKAGDVIARLVNLPLHQEIERLAGERNQAELYLRELEARRSEDPAAAAQLPAAAETLAALSERLQQKTRDAERLVILSPAPGVVLAPPRRRPETGHPALPAWRGTPLDEQNATCWLETGTLLCQIGDPDRVEPVLVISQVDVDLVRAGQRVRLQVDQRPGEILSGVIDEIAAVNMEVVPRDMANARDLASRLDASGVARPVETSYQARVTLDEHNLPLILRGGGRARISTDPAPLGPRLLRALRQVFHFKL